MSGGYWIAMSADEIWASSGTITGSIGIYGLVMTFPDTLAKIGITTDPKLSFPGQRSLEVVRPLVQLLKSEVSNVSKSAFLSMYAGFVVAVEMALEHSILIDDVR